MRKGKDLTGIKYGLLTVIGEDLEKRIRDFKRKEIGEISCVRTYWKCQCECGNIVSLDGSYLKGGTITSCGCDKKI